MTLMLIIIMTSVIGIVCSGESDNVKDVLYSQRKENDQGILCAASENI